MWFDRSEKKSKSKNEGVWGRDYEFEGTSWWFYRGVNAFRRLESMICDLECKVRWYFVGCGGFEGFSKGLHKSLNLDLLGVEVGVYLIFCKVDLQKFRTKVKSTTYL